MSGKCCCCCCSCLALAPQVWQPPNWQKTALHWLAECWPMLMVVVLLRRRGYRGWVTGRHRAQHRSNLSSSAVVKANTALKAAAAFEATPATLSLGNAGAISSRRRGRRRRRPLPFTAQTEREASEQTRFLSDGGERARRHHRLKSSGSAASKGASPESSSRSSRRHRILIASSGGTNRRASRSSRRGTGVTQAKGTAQQWQCAQGCKRAAAEHEELKK